MKENNKTFVFLCDVNNVLLMIASQLYKRGIKVKYVPDLRLNQHFRIWDAPIDSEYSLENFTDFSNRVNIDINLISAQSPEQVREQLLSVIDADSIVIGSDYAPAIFEYANLRLDYFAVTGADVNNHTLIHRFTKALTVKQAFFTRHRAEPIFKRINKSLNSTDLPTLQRRGIFNSKIIINSDHFNWTPLEVKDFISIPYPLPGAVKQFGEASSGNNSILKKTILKEKVDCDLLIINISKNDFWKGTHLFFEGFSNYTKLNRLRAKLLIFGRGNLGSIRRSNPEVDLLIEEGKIVIMPPVAQKDVEEIINQCDICFGGIWPESKSYESNPSFAYDWNTSLMQYSKLCKPIITYSPFEGKFSGFNDIEIYPHEAAKDANEVCNAIVRLESDDSRKKYAQDMQRWITDFTETSITKWMEVLNN